MNEKIFIDKFINAYFANITQEQRKVLSNIIQSHFQTVQDVSLYLNQTGYNFVDNVRDTFYSSLTDEEKLEWALIS